MVSWDKSGKHSHKEKPGDPIFARVPLSDLTLAEAREAVDDASWFDETRIPILFHFTVTPDEYESLTVGTHAEMLAYLKLRGLVDGDL